MVRTLAMAVAIGWFGLWSDSEGNHLQDCKVIEPDKTKCCSRLVGEVPSSLTNEDHISELPYEVLHNILARLSLRDVARMATISRWWRSSCSSLPFLDLDWVVMSGFDPLMHDDERCPNYYKTFINGVDQVLEKWKDQKILSFRLACCLFYSKYSDDFDRWISFATANQGLESLTLQFICGNLSRFFLKSTRRDDYVGRYPFFECSQDDQYVFHGSMLAHFPCLKALHLNTCILEFQNEIRLNNITTLHVILRGFSQWQSVVSSLSAIMWLRISGCKLPKTLCIPENSECLSFLMIHDCYGIQELEIHATNLKTFDFDGVETVKFSFSNSVKLESLAVGCRTQSQVAAEYMYRGLVENSPSVKDLHIRGKTPELYKLPSYRDSYGLVSRLHLGFCTLSGGNPGIDAVKGLYLLLKSFPVLKVLCVQLPYVERGKRPKIQEPFIHTKLKEVQLYCFKEVWTEFANYLLRNAVVLEYMMLKSYTKIYIGGSWLYMSMPHSRGESERIFKQVQGNAISARAKVYIVDNRCTCRNELCMFAN